MEKKLFADLVESVTQMDEIVRGERAPSREFTVDPPNVRTLGPGDDEDDDEDAKPTRMR